MVLLWLVEDSIGQLQSFTSLLTKMGYEVVSFRDGDELLERLPSLPAPQAIIMDLALAGTRNGFQIAQQILKSRPEISAEQFIFITGWKRQFMGIIPTEFLESSMIDKADWTVDQITQALEKARTLGN